jgi:hypothetical protein
MEITFDRKTVGTCLQQRFTLPTYQRDYRWETKHLQELLTDIQEEFLQNYDPAHGRTKVGEYTRPEYQAYASNGNPPLFGRRAPPTVALPIPQRPSGGHG